MQQFTGTYTALVTPFRDDRVDAEAYRRLIDWQIESGVDGIVAVGTTGESPTLDHGEHLEVIRLAVEAVRGRVKVIAGTGSNCTREAIAMTLEAEGVGADAARCSSRLITTSRHRKGFTVITVPLRTPRNCRSSCTASRRAAAWRSASRRHGGWRRIAPTSSPSRKRAAAWTASVSWRDVLPGDFTVHLR